VHGNKSQEKKVIALDRFSDERLENRPESIHSTMCVMANPEACRVHGVKRPSVYL